MSFIMILASMVAAYSIVFHFLMTLEGKEFSWVTGFYWTLTVMTTLGFGDITFEGDIGRLFSILVLLSGVIFMLILLPFTFIRFFLAPWMEAESRRRVPRELPPETADHIIITAHNAVTAALIERLTTYARQYVVIVEDYDQAILLYSKGIKVAIGNIDDMETYKKMRVDKAALVVSGNSDEINTNVAFTVRELNGSVPVITTADSPHSVDVLSMAGSSLVVDVSDLLGRSFANWTLCGECQANIIGRFHELVIAEVPAINTPLVGKTLAETRLAELFGINVAAMWERGKILTPTPETRIARSTVLLLAGTEKQIITYDEVFSIYQIFRQGDDPVIIIGGGRVGTAIAKRFEERAIRYTIVEKNPRRVKQKANTVLGDAADLSTLQQAWIEKAPVALVTTHDDATNIYFTKYLRSLRPDMQIISRANVNRNVSTLHRAGADFVISYSVLGANIMFNFLMKQEALVPIEGLTLFVWTVPPRVILTRSHITRQTGCGVVAVRSRGEVSADPDAGLRIEPGAEIILIGTYEAERKFFQVFGKKR
jgi:Trk K+ transport system NAD-binding subunit